MHVVIAPGLRSSLINKKKVYYNKHPFLVVGLPFLTLVVLGTGFLSDLRRCKYEQQQTCRKGLEKDALGEDNKKKTLKSLEDELRVCTC